MRKQQMELNQQNEIKEIQSRLRISAVEISNMGRTLLDSVLPEAVSGITWCVARIAAAKDISFISLLMAVNKYIPIWADTSDSRPEMFHYVISEALEFGHIDQLLAEIENSLR